MKFLQKLGKALMLPVACLPICGILMGIGYALCPATMQGGDITGILEQIVVKTSVTITRASTEVFITFPTPFESSKTVPIYLKLSLSRSSSAFFSFSIDAIASIL